jgi:hypothetical protein
MQWHYSVRTLVMRVLASVIVVCLVVATGIHPVAAAQERQSTVEASRARVSLHARVVEVVGPGGTTSQSSRRFRASGGSELPAILVGDPAALAPPALSSVDLIAGRSLVVRPRRLSTCSARGPPVV